MEALIDIPLRVESNTLIVSYRGNYLLDFFAFLIVSFLSICFRRNVIFGCSFRILGIGLIVSLHPKKDAIGALF